MATQTATLLYVYGVTDSSAPPALKGIGSEQVKAVCEGDLTSLVSELPHDSGRVALGRDELNAHAAVLEEAMHTGTVLPMRFGVVMESEAAVRENLLSAHRQSLQQQLGELSGKVELRLRATYEEQALLREVVREHQEIVSLRESIKGRPDDATYYERIRLGELVAEAVEQKRRQDAAELLQVLEPLAIATEAAEPSHERVALNASFLVSQDQIEAFDHAVDELGRRQRDRMRMKYVGPLPPYSFTHLETGGEA